MLRVVAARGEQFQAARVEAEGGRPGRKLHAAIPAATFGRCFSDRLLVMTGRPGVGTAAAHRRGAGGVAGWESQGCLAERLVPQGRRALVG